VSWERGRVGEWERARVGEWESGRGGKILLLPSDFFTLDFFTLDRKHPGYKPPDSSVEK
jgi:hypothetical protein